MRTRFVSAVIGVTVSVAGCGPDINSISPVGQQRLEMVTIKGNRMLGALISIDGEPVGAAAVSALADPLHRRDVCIPLQKPDTTLTGVGTPDNRATITAWDNVGSDDEHYNNITSPGTAPTPSILGVTPPVPDLLTGRFSVTVSGMNLYPGAGSGKVTSSTPFAGPQAHFMPGVIPADETVYLDSGNVMVYFRPATLVSGNAYAVQITNDARYGSGSATSSATFQAP